jgi:hypothetical protein
MSNKDQVLNIFNKLDTALTKLMREKINNPNFSLRECYACSKQTLKEYIYYGVFPDRDYEVSPDFVFYALYCKNNEDFGAVTFVDGEGLIATPETLFKIRQMFDEKYDAIKLRGHIKPFVIENYE